MSRNYLNKENQELYILHFPGSGLDTFQYILDENLDREIAISSNLSIISEMNKKCWESSPLKKQCEKNSIQIYNSAFNEQKWDNTKKIQYILEDLKKIKTDYVLILDGRDVSIVNNLDNNFIQKFENFNYPIIYNGTPAAFPDVPIESMQEIVKIKGKQKFLNAGVCIGKKDALIDFYSKAQEINQQYVDNDSEQLIIRLTRARYPHLAFWDTNNTIFRIAHHYDTKALIQDNNIILI